MRVMYNLVLLFRLRLLVKIEVVEVVLYLGEDVVRNWELGYAF